MQRQIETGESIFKASYARLEYNVGFYEKTDRQTSRRHGVVRMSDPYSNVLEGQYHNDDKHGLFR